MQNIAKVDTTESQAEHSGTKSSGNQKMAKITYLEDTPNAQSTKFAQMKKMEKLMKMKKSDQS